MSDPFRKLVEDIGLQGWIRDYIDHGTYTETLASFRCMTALTLSAAMLKRKVHLDMRTFKVWPAFQTMIVGPAGLARKSTTALYGYDVLSTLRKQLEEGGEVLPRLMPNSGSKEGLIQDMTNIYEEDGQVCGIQIVSELATYLNKAKYVETLVGLLLDVYDGHDVPILRSTKTSGQMKEVNNIAISAIMCSNEEMLAGSIPSEAIRGGFPSRVVIMYDVTQAKDVPLPYKMPKPRHSKAQLAEWLYNLVPKVGTATLTPDAEKWHEEWYARRPKTGPPDIIPFLARLQSHQLRIGLLIAATQDDKPNVVIQAEHLQQAQAILDYALKRMPDLYKRLATGQFGQWYEEVKRLLRVAGGQMSQAHLGKQMSNLSGSQMQEVLRTLQSNGEIEVSVAFGRRDHVVRLKNERGS